ncbi:bifunctional diguanylate cyclase/phosphodiesterase [Mycobacterium sp. B14F4]|uniref:putative bifunctional diguanylate cyclase/phosphodiesterase n=1 Tax=Mycobacterium sp. B14F4 TaxID=3153565 RepID=UPI00325EB000
MSTFARVASIATGAAIVFTVWLIGGWGGESTVRVVDSLGMIGFAVFATVCSALAARSAQGRQRQAWTWMTVGLGGWTFGEILCALLYLVLGQVSTPSVADIGYLLYPVGAIMALILFPVGYSNRSQARIVLDGLLVAAAMFEVYWLVLLRDVYPSAGVQGPLALSVSLAYPITDLMIITVAVLVLMRACTAHRLTLVLLTAGNVLNALSDTLFTYLSARGAYEAGSLVDVGWVGGLLLLALAGLHGSRVSQSDLTVEYVPTRPELWLPYVPVVIAAVVCMPELMPMDSLGPLVVSSVVIVLILLARQVLVVGENRRLLATAAAQALRDPLTGLANRTLFYDRLTHALQLHRGDGQSVVVMSLDLDDFKLVNDSLGHWVGDAVLVEAASRVSASVRESDTVARVGGDELAVLMEGGIEDVRVVADRVVEAFDDPFAIDGHDLAIRPSVGLALAGTDGRDTTPEVLLKQADAAMYSAKRSGTGRVHTFSPDMYLFQSAPNGAVKRRGAMAVRMLGELRQAIANFDLSLVYQPKFDLASGEIVGVEALIRWPHPERGLLGPDHFLPLVRRHGLMGSMTEFVVARALDDAAWWRSKGVGLPIAINLFAPSLEDPRLPSQIVDALTARNLPTDTLTVEITEHLLLNNLDRTRKILDKLRYHGIRISIDDFGSGYSALSYLRELPIDEIKLDRQFVAPVLVDWRSASIIHAVIDLAHALNAVTVAEGVENGEAAARLRSYGCDVVQGYLYSPPLTPVGILDLLFSPDRTVTTPREPSAAKSS